MEYKLFIGQHDAAYAICAVYKHRKVSATVRTWNVSQMEYLIWFECSVKCTPIMLPNVIYEEYMYSKVKITAWQYENHVSSINNSRVIH